MSKLDNLITEWSKTNVLTDDEKSSLLNCYINMLLSNNNIDDYINLHYPGHTLDTINIQHLLKLSIQINKDTKLDSEEKAIINNLGLSDEIDNLNDFNKTLFYNPNISFDTFMVKKIPNNPYKVLEYTDSYEYGIQEAKCNSEMYYIRFYDMLVMDIYNIKY
jgi:hypothetical protein